jgi:fluoroquinolone transport system permease protein
MNAQLRLLFQRMAWETRILQRNQLLVLTVVITALYVALFQLLKLLHYDELFAILLVLNDPAMLGILFVGVTVIFEHESGSLAALQVTPLSTHVYLSARLVVLGLLGAVSGWVMCLALIGWEMHHIGFLLGTFAITFAFGAMGFVLSARPRRVLDYMLRAVGILVLAGMPLFDWFGVLDIPLIWLNPIEHGIRILAWSFHFRILAFPWASALVLVATCVATYAWAYRRFTRLHLR